ncbi:MAG: ATP-binding protein, partial [Bacteroidota bacterium]
AVQAIPDDRPGKVAVKLFKEADTAVIQVSDNGSGIPKEMMDKVFVPNFTTKSSGTGIGLAISKNIIESVNGQIYFKTVLDQGTDFFVKLPVEKVEELENA